MRDTIAILIVVLVLLPAGAGVATAQPTTPTGPVSGGGSTAAPPDTPTPVGGENNSSGGGWSIPGLGFDPEALGEWAVSGAIYEGQRAATGSVDYVTTLISGMPAPGQADDPTTWIDPQNGLWPGTWETWRYSLGLSTVILSFATLAAFGKKASRDRKRKLIMCGVAVGMAAGTFIVLSPALHLTAIVSTAIAPDSSDFFGSLGSITKLGAGIVFALLLAYFATGVVAAGLIVLAAQFFSVHAAVALWPVAWAFIALGGAWRSVGASIVYLFVTILMLNILQALILRLVFEVPWDASPVGPVMGPLFLVVGLAVALVYLPKEGIKQAWQSAGVRHGMEAAEGIVPDNAQEAKAQASESIGRMKKWRSEGDKDSSGGGGSGFPSAGDPGVSSARTFRSRKAGSFGNQTNSGQTADASEPAAEKGSSTIDPNHGYQ